MNQLKTLNQRFKPLKNPPKTQWIGDVGWMVDCEIAELTKFANLGHYLPNIPSPLVLCALRVRKKS